MNSLSKPTVADLKQPICISETVPVNAFAFTRSDAFQLPADVFPLPSPITIRLLTIGIPHNVAEMMSNAYLEEARKLKEITEGVVTKASAMLCNLPSHDTKSIALLRQQVIQVHQSKYKETLLNWEEQAESLALSRLQSMVENEQVQTSHSSKKMKRRFKSEFLPLFEFAFSKDRFPSREDKKHLARISGMSYRQISVWFQNRRCRSGKYQDESPILGEARTGFSGCTRLTTKGVFNYQRNIENEATKCSSPDIIDLTIEEKPVTAGDTDIPFPGDEREEKSEPEEYSTSDTPSESDSACSNSLFPAPYVPSVPDSDPFTLKVESSLWQRRRGLKRQRSNERVIQVEDVISDLESMDVTTPAPPRPIKSLPKRLRAGIFAFSLSSPALSSRRSFSYGSEPSVYSLDNPSYSPLSRTSSYSTVVSSALQSPELSEIDLPPVLISENSVSDHSEWDREAEDQCFHYPEMTTLCEEVQRFETTDDDLSHDEVGDSDSCDSRPCITNPHCFKPGSLHLRTDGWNKLLAA